MSQPTDPALEQALALSQQQQQALAADPGIPRMSFPIATQYALFELTTEEGQRFVIMRLENAAGTFAFWFTAEAAQQLADNIAESARRAGSSLHLPPEVRL